VKNLQEYKVTASEKKIDKGERVLMLCAGFFGYEKRISDALRNAGYEVDLYDERPSAGFFGKSCVRYNLHLYYPVIRRYYQRIIEKNRDNGYKYVFVVKGEAVSETVIKMLRQAYPTARFILYLWDSVDNIPDCRRRMREYDRVLTFDPEDARTYGLVFRPLFYCNEFTKRKTVEQEGADVFTFDFAFIGTAHSDRPRIAGQLQRQCGQRGGRCYLNLYLPHILVFYYHKLLNPAYRHVHKEEINFTPMCSAEINAVYERSRCILDVEHNKQHGLTIRTIEMIGLQKKLITTNAAIKQYDFYRPANICVIDRENPVLDVNFLKTSYEALPDEIYEKYSIGKWIKDIFETEAPQ